jgi:hypothetical protein
MLYFEYLGDEDRWQLWSEDHSVDVVVASGFDPARSDNDGAEARHALALAWAAAGLPGAAALGPIDPDGPYQVVSGEGR